MKLPTLVDLELEKARRSYNKIDLLFPDTGRLKRSGYAKHTAFFEAGFEHSERIFLAGNRVGKSYSGLYEDVCHLTGIYPPWWKGKRFDTPVKMWLAAPTAEKTRDSLQYDLIGNIDEYGTGLLPKDKIILARNGLPGSSKQGISKALDTVRVRHISGGMSVLKFKSYKEGVLSFESETVHVVHLDEEPPLEIWVSSLARTMTVDGIVSLTLTPLLGLTPLIAELTKEESTCFVVSASWDDAPHLTTEQKDRLWAAIPEYQRDARSKGIPALGSGAVFPVAESRIVVEPFVIPDHWFKIRGMDTGWKWTSACFLAFDQETQVTYLFDEYKAGREHIAVHATSILAKGKNLDGPCDYSGTDQSTGIKVIDQYAEHGLDLYAANKAGKEGDLFQMLSDMQMGQFKVFSTCQQFLEERRMYRRDEHGKIVKTDDHIIDAVRYAYKVPISEWTQGAVQRHYKVNIYKSPIDEGLGCAHKMTTNEI